ncbi:MAG: 4'-phosphopantetheinyl transferase superfamily protein [Pedobacter sp.]|uniref:4'-phosphopantetheinyl transferase family protein n=1 Tax=Pedobacter sp. TaxID=1411316 RepID=UPI0035682F24
MKVIDFTLPQVEWQDYNSNVELSKGITHIFKINIVLYESIKPEYLSVLDQKEITKANRFKNEDDKKRYVIGKYFSRIILSSFLNLEPKDILFSFTGNKKPYIEGAHFNISHSGRFTIIAISPVAIGIDIEYINAKFDFSPLLNICFKESELNSIHDIVDFYTLWTRKEAILKASGEGLIDNLHDIDCLKNVVKRNHINFSISSKKLEDDHIISLAINTLHPNLNYWDFTV